MQQRRSVKSAAAQQRTRLKLKETAMDVRGYPTGPIDAKGAFTSEIDLPPIIKPGPLNTVAEADRPHLVDQPGMRHKYLPLRHDPATGAISSGGRYLFRARPSTATFLRRRSSPVNRQPSGSVRSSSTPSGSPGA
jgi:hypothetical protein